MNVLEMDLSYTFTIFFVTIGPLKVILPFHQATSQLENNERRNLALKGTLSALIILLGVMVLAHYIIHSWKISEMAIQITGGLILFVTSFRIIDNTHHTQQNNEKEEQYIKKSNIQLTGLSPVAIPIIISPVGLLAAIAVMSLAKNDWGVVAKVASIMASILFLDFLIMTFANAIMKKIKIMALYAIGWIFALLQAVLGIQFLINGILNIIRQY